MNKREMYDYIASRKPLTDEVNDTIWDYSEIAYEEFRSAAYLCGVLEREGFKVERAVAGIETAFTATFGSGKPVIGLAAEYDALSGLDQQAGNPHKCSEPATKGNGHGCGHNSFAAGVVGAAIGVKRYMEENKVAGTLVFLGCPAEEGGSGKAFMARDGVFDNCDCAVTWHPGNLNAVRTGSNLANIQAMFSFEGVSAHAAGDPHRGRSALDAVELLNVGVQFLREHIPTTWRVHYAITDAGGFSPNVVQSHAKAMYLMRSPTSEEAAELYERVQRIAAGAALMTDTKLDIQFIKACSDLMPNDTLQKTAQKNLEEAPLPVYTDAEWAFAAELGTECGAYAAPDGAPAGYDKPMVTYVSPLRPSEEHTGGSSDVGDLSRVTPTVWIDVACGPIGTPGHSWQRTSAGRTELAKKGVVYAAQAMAGIVTDLFADEKTIDDAKAELDRRLGGKKYACPIPKGIKPRKMTL